MLRRLPQPDEIKKNFMFQKYKVCDIIKSNEPYCYDGGLSSRPTYALRTRDGNTILVKLPEGQFKLGKVLMIASCGIRYFLVSGHEKGLFEYSVDDIKKLGGVEIPIDKGYEAQKFLKYN